MTDKQTLGPYRLDTSPAKVEAFARAVGASIRDQIPPTYLTLCREGEFKVLEKLGIPLSKVLHGEQSYEYFAPIKAGDELSYETHLASHYEKKGSKAKLTFLVVESRVFRTSDRSKVARSCTTMIVREAVK